MNIKELCGVISDLVCVKMERCKFVFSYNNLNKNFKISWRIGVWEFEWRVYLF